MLVPGDSACPACGHPRRNHDFGNLVGGVERCDQCECTIPVAQVHFEWYPNAEPQPFDWSSALDMIVLMVEMETSCTEFVLGATPSFAIAPDELQDLSNVERTVRDIWTRYVPPSPALRKFSPVAAENAAVDAYENSKAQLRDALRNVVSDDGWRDHFSTADHAAIERVRAIITSRQAGAS